MAFLLAKPTPHNVNHDNDRFSMFNKKRDIPRRHFAATFGTKGAWERSVAELKVAGIWNEGSGVTFEDMQDALKSVNFRIPTVCLRWTDGQPHGGVSPGFNLAETEIIFPLSTNLVLRGSFDGEESVIEADGVLVAAINSLVISNAHNQVYAYDHSFKFMREDPVELGSGATLVQDKRFLLAGMKPEERNVVALKTRSEGNQKLSTGVTPPALPVRPR
jgi:hypothetical protein